MHWLAAVVTVLVSARATGVRSISLLESEVIELILRRFRAAPATEPQERIYGRAGIGGATTGEGGGLRGSETLPTAICTTDFGVPAL